MKINKDNAENFLYMANKHFYDKHIYDDRDVSVDSLFIKEGNSITGGCPKKLWFEMKKFPVSDKGLYEVEKELKINTLLSNSYNKVYHYEDSVNNDFSSSYILHINPNKIELKCADKEFKIKNIPVVQENELVYYLFRTLNSDKKFEGKINKLVEGELLFVIALFSEIVYSKKPLSKVAIIYKHEHNFKERMVIFEKISSMGKEYLAIDKIDTGICISEYYEKIKDALRLIKKNINDKTIPQIINTERCTGCYWRSLCKTM